jgi:hypothetical protein
MRKWIDYLRCAKRLKGDYDWLIGIYMLSDE